MNEYRLPVPEEGTSFPVLGVAGAVGGVLVLVVLAVIIVGAIVCVKKLRRVKDQNVASPSMVRPSLC